MRTMIAFFILFLGSWWSTSAVFGQSVPENSSVEAEIHAVMAERTKASLEGDTNKVESLMADEYLQTDVNGHVQNKSAWLTEYFKPIAALIKAGKFRWEVYEENNVQNQLFGDSAVVIGSLTLKPKGAIPVPGRGWVVSTQDVPARTLRFTRVYIRRNGKWLLAALQNAWLPAEGNSGPEAELVSLTNAWTDAILAKDQARLDALMAPDFALHAWQGEADVPRARWLENLLQHLKIPELEHSAIVARVYGDIATVTSKYYWRGSFNDKPFENHGYVVDVWRRSYGRWQVVSRTSVSLPGREQPVAPPAPTRTP